MKNTLPPDYFERIYDANSDPWDFVASDYEAAKYAATIAALPRERYASAFEIGCSIGVLTEKLAARCEQLLSVDVAEKALASAAKRCENLPQIRFQAMNFPAEFPTETFDLIIVSEVGYYLSSADWRTATTKIIELLRDRGTIILVHWTPFVADYPQTGDAVHEDFKIWTTADLHLRQTQREEKFRLDVYEKK